MGLYRYRSSNYTADEKILLIEVVKEYADMIDCRRTEVATAKGKTGVWDLIAETFNLRKGLGPRPAMSLRKCYSNMKTIVKNVIRSHNLESVTGSIQEDWEMNIHAVASKLGLSYEVTYDFMYNVLKYRIQGDTLSLERVRKGAAQEDSQNIIPVLVECKTYGKPHNSLTLDEKARSSLTSDENARSSLVLDENARSSLVLDENARSSLVLDEKMPSSLDEKLPTSLTLDEKISSSMAFESETSTLMPIIESVRTEAETETFQNDNPEPEDKSVDKPGDDVIPEPAVVWVTSEPSGYDFLPEDSLFTDSESQAGDALQSNNSLTQDEDKSESNSSVADEDSSSIHVRKKMKV